MSDTSANRKPRPKRVARINIKPFQGLELGLSGYFGQYDKDDNELGGFAIDWKAARGEDAASGTTALGPHRTDLRATHLAKAMPAELCSTGEQKALLVALVLAHARLLAADSGRAPLLLLDEVAAHLDEPRREALFAEVLQLGCQAWLTGTDATIFTPLGGRAQRFAVAEGRIRPA